MKSLLFISIISLLLPLASLQAQNTNKFSGTITYQITYPNAANNPMVAQLPTKLEMKISGNKFYTEMVLPFGKNAFILNGDEPSMIRLINLEKGNYFIKKAKEDIKNPAAAVITKTKENKTIAGIKCSAAEVSIPGQPNKRKVYFSEELGDNNIYFNTDLRAIKGILLEFDYNLMGMPVQLTAVSVNAGRVSNKEFDMPKGYTETTEAKLRELKGPVNKK